LAKQKYIKRHNRVCAQLHFNACKKMEIKLDNKHGYEYVPKVVETSHRGKVTVYQIKKWKQIEPSLTINRGGGMIRDNE
jgi:hypothetical protein